MPPYAPLCALCAQKRVFCSVLTLERVGKGPPRVSPRRVGLHFKSCPRAAPELLPPVCPPCVHFIRIFKCFLLASARERPSPRQLASARVASGCISKSAPEPPQREPSGCPKTLHLQAFCPFCECPKALPASRRVAFQNLSQSRPKGAATLSGCLNVSKNKQLQAKTHSASAQRPSPRQPASHRVAFQILSQSRPKGALWVPKSKHLQAKSHSASAQRPSPRRVAFQSAPETSIFASADPCRKLAILQSENDHLGHFCLKVAPRAFKASIFASADPC